MNILYLVSRPMWAQMYGIRNGFIANGHRVITAAPPPSASGQHIDRALEKFDPEYHVDITCEPDEPIDQIIRKMRTEPDLIFYIENMVPFLPKNLTEIDIPTVGLFSEDTKNSDWETYLLPHFDIAPRLTMQAVRNANKLDMDNVVYWYYGGADYYHMDHNLERDVDVVLLGNFSNWHPERTATLPHILKLRDEGYKIIVRNNVFFEDYAYWHSRAKITYNCSQEACYLNFRVMEAMASGCMVVTNKVRDPEDPSFHYFTDRQHLVYYDEGLEAVERIREFLQPEMDEMRQTIALEGRDFVQSKYTYTDATRFFLEEFVDPLPKDFLAQRKERFKRLGFNVTRIGRDTARYFYFTGDFKRAAEVAGRIKSQTLDAGTRNLVGVIQAASGEFQAGVDHLVEAVNLQPANPLFHYNLAQLLSLARSVGAKPGDVVDMIHRALYRLERIPEAIKEIDIADTFWPQDTGRFRLQLARALYHSHAPAEYDELVRNAFRYQLYLTLGRVCMETGDWPQSLKGFEMAMECLGERDGFVLAEMAEMYRRMGDPGKAIVALEEAAALEPFHYYAQLRLSSLHAQAQRYTLAANILETMLVKYPVPKDVQIQALAALSEIYDAQVDVPNLRRTWERLLEIDPNHPGLGDRLALLPDQSGVHAGEQLAITYYGRFDNSVQAYPIINQALTRELKRRGMTVFNNEGGSNIAITFVWPPEPPKPDHLVNIALFCWEFTSIPDHYVAIFNSYDYLITFSEHNREMLVANGVQTPIDVILLGLDQENYFPVPVSRTNSTFRFLFVGGTNTRHGFDVALQAFKEEFSSGEDVELVVKISASYPGLADDLAAGYNIRLINQPFSPGQMLSLYNASDALLYPVRGVGIGLPALEALACGVPVITTDWSAIREYVQDYNAAYTLVDTPNENGVSSTVPNQFAQPDLADIRRWMRRLYEDPQAAKQKAMETRARLLSQVSYAAAADNLIHFLQSLPAFALEPTRYLEIGPGNSPHMGYEHLDVRADLPHIEWVHDFNQDLPFEAGTFNEILSSHSIEHVSWRKVIGILKDWCRVLRPGGRARIYTPDFEYLCKQYAAGNTDTNIEKIYPEFAEQELGGYDPATWAMIKMFAGQEYDANFHAGVYDFNLLARFLKIAGFHEVHRLPFLEDLHLEAIKLGPAQRLDQARHLIRDGSLQAALAELHNLTQDYPTFPEAWLEMGVVWLCGGQPSLAQEAIERALVLDPRSSRAERLLQYIGLLSSKSKRSSSDDLVLVFSGTKILAAPRPPDIDRRWTVVPMSVESLTAAPPGNELSFVGNSNGKKPSKQHPKMSVLLCTYNRKDNLQKCIAALNKQTLAPDEYEIVLVNDGSTDGTEQIVPTLKVSSSLQYFQHEKNRGLAAARNTAIAAAQGKYLVFINDDTFPEPTMLAEHLAFLEKANDPYLASLGRIFFIPQFRELAVSEAIEKYNYLFPYSSLRTDRDYDFDYFVTGNVVVARQPFVDHDLRFNETFHRYGCEDIELGYRLWKNGMRVQYNPRAVAQHEHLMSAASYFRREVFNSYNQIQFVAMHPELMVRYLSVPNLSQDTVHSWYLDWQKLIPQLDDLLANLGKIEHRPVSELIGQNLLGEVCKTRDDVIRKVGQAFYAVGTLGRLQGKLESISEHPGIASRLAGTTILTSQYAPYKSAKASPSSVALSVIVPTYNRKEHLARCLTALKEQTLSYDQFEVIVVDDGSTDGTGESLQGKYFPYRLHFLQQENAGPGAARNRGLEEAAGEVVLFIGDDMLATSDLLAGHLDFHRQHPQDHEAVVGHVSWYAANPITPFMEYIVGDSGVQFGFSRIKDRENASFSYFYTSNISLKRSFLANEQPLFDPDYWYPAMEDIDAGYRLERKGMRLRYRSHLVVFHDHPTDLEKYRQRQFHAGQMMRLFAHKHPESGLAQYTDSVYQNALAQPEAIAKGADENALVAAALELEARLAEGAAQQDRKELYQLFGLVLDRSFVRGILAGDQKSSQEFAPAPEGPAFSATTVHALEELLGADDILEALDTNAYRLDTELLSLVRLNAETARLDGDVVLAEGLENLASYINDYLHRNNESDSSENLGSPRVAFYGRADEVNYPLRVGLPASALAKGGFQTEALTHFSVEDLACYDVFVFSRPHLNANFLEGLSAAARAGKRTIIDLDDNFHEIPPDHPGYATVGRGNLGLLSTLEKALYVADAVVGSTPELVDYYSRWARKTRVIPNGWDKTDPTWLEPSAERNTLNLGWAGTMTHRQDVLLMKSAITRLLKKYPHVRLVIGGDPEVMNLFQDLPENQRTFLPFVPYGNYPAMLAKFDILLAPLRENAFNACKSDIKLLEAGIRGIPWLASPSPAYLAWHTGGLFARTDEEWYAQLERLVGDSELRSSLGQAGYQKALERDSHEIATNWSRLFADLGFGSPVASQEVTEDDHAAALFRALLEAEDIETALQDHADEFDDDLLDLIRIQVELAQTEGNEELASGLEALTEVVGYMMQG